MLLVKVLVLTFKTVHVKLRCDLKRFVYAGNRFSFYLSFCSLELSLSLVILFFSSSECTARYWPKTKV